ncbi:ferredoxin-type protein NapF [Thalassotalea montiporae]
MEQVANRARRQLLKGRFKAQVEKAPIRLPWTASEAVFTATCTQCNKCVEHCETQVIKRDRMGFPFLDFSQAECTFCGECERQCDQPLFIAQAHREANRPWPADIEINSSCLATNQVYCQSCRDVCDSRAISFQFITSAIPVPVIKNDDCTLCGACISTCPQKAIAINHNTNSAGYSASQFEELNHEPIQR